MTLLQLEQLKATAQALLLCINKDIQNERRLHKQVIIKALIIKNIWATVFNAKLELSSRNLYVQTQKTMQYFVSRFISVFYF